MDSTGGRLMNLCRISRRLRWTSAMDWTWRIGQLMDLMNGLPRRSMGLCRQRTISTSRMDHISPISLSGRSIWPLGRMGCMPIDLSHAGGPCLLRRSILGERSLSMMDSLLDIDNGPGPIHQWPSTPHRQLDLVSQHLDNGRLREYSYDFGLSIDLANCRWASDISNRLHLNLSASFSSSSLRLR